MLKKADDLFLLFSDEWGTKDEFVVSEHPHLKEYLIFHNFIDRFCWLIKLHYSERDAVRRKKFRLDRSFQYYLSWNKITPQSLHGVRLAREDSKICFSLLKGWHNEIISGKPFASDYLLAGTSLHERYFSVTGSAASWVIIQNYYALFDYLSTVAYCENNVQQIDGHKKLANKVNNHLLGALSPLFSYPFILSSRTIPSQIPEHPKHCQYHYATYPRDRVSICVLEKQILDLLRMTGDGKVHSFLDVFYNFRLWANYTGGHSLLKMREGGYLGFLLKNLSFLAFFVGGLAEIASIAALGEEKFISTVKQFSSSCIEKNSEYSRDKYLLPIFVRLKIYKHLGFISCPIEKLLIGADDPIQYV